MNDERKFKLNPVLPDKFDHPPRHVGRVVIPSGKRHQPRPPSGTEPTRRRRPVPAWVPASLVGGLLFVVLACLLFVHLERANRAASIELIRTEKLRGEAVELHSAVAKASERVEEIHREAVPYVTPVREAVAFVTGENLPDMSAPEPEMTSAPEPEMAPQPALAVAGTTPNAAPRVAKSAPPADEEDEGRPEGLPSLAQLEARRKRVTASPPPIPRAAQPPVNLPPPSRVAESGPPADEEDEGRPEGLPSLAQLEARKKGVTASPPPSPRAAQPPANPPPPSFDAAAPAAPPAPPAPAAWATAAAQPEIRAVAMQVLVSVQRCATMVSRRQAAIRDADAAMKASRKAGTSDEAAEARNRLTKLRREAEVDVGEAQAAFTAAKEGHARVLKLRDDHAAELAARKAEAERAAEAARVAQQEADEKERAVQASGAVVERMREHEFTAVLAELESLLAELETPPGKEALQPALLRARFAKEVLTELADDLERENLRWVWGTGSEKEDIVGADEQSLHRLAGKVPWNKVEEAQMRTILLACAARESAGLKLRGRLRLLAGVLSSAAGNLEQARADADAAAALQPSLSHLAGKLMP